MRRLQPSSSSGSRENSLPLSVVIVSKSSSKEPPNSSWMARSLHDRTALFLLHLAQTWKSALAFRNGQKRFLPPASTKHEVGFPMPEGCTCHNTRSTIINAMPIRACLYCNAAVSLLSSGTLRQINAFATRSVCLLVRTKKSMPIRRMSFDQRFPNFMLHCQVDCIRCTVQYFPAPCGQRRRADL